jgi:hypothetical protein
MYPSRMILSNQEDHKGVPPYRLPRFRDDARESTELNHAKQEATNSKGKFPDDVNRRDKMFMWKGYRDIRVYVSQHAACGRELFSIR